MMINSQQQSFREKIRLICDLTELQGTCYFEILPGKYQDKCWNQNSVFMTEEVFGYLEPIFERQAPNFDHYAFVEVVKNDWILILADFASLISILEQTHNIHELEGKMEFSCRYSMERFGDNFSLNAIDLIALIRDFSAWVKEQLKSKECISVLGI
jgi:hypothetical protein